MKFRILKPSDLNADLCSAWTALLGEGPWRSPFFRPEFAQLAGSIRPEAQICLGEDQAGPALFFPFQRGSFGSVTPLAGRLSDFHGVVARPALEWRMEEVLAGCGAASLEFDHWIAADGPLAPYISSVDASRYLDLAAGYSAYEAERLASMASDFREVMRRRRKLAKDFREVVFTWNSADPAVWTQLLSWKSEQYLRTGMTDVLAFPWVRRLLEGVRDQQTPALSGVLSSLHLDGRLAAVHFGMRSGGVLHSWFPAYDRELSKASPGIVLLLMIAQQAPAEGVARIDLGKGDESYKVKLAGSADPVATGVIDLRPLATTVRSAWRKTRDWVRGSPLNKQLDAPVAWIRRLREWAALR